MKSGSSDRLLASLLHSVSDFSFRSKPARLSTLGHST